MIKHYVQIIFRNFLRNKSISVLKILGLSVGIASVLLIYFWIFNELSFDKFHNNYENIYRVVVTHTRNDESYYAETPVNTSEIIQKNIPEIQNSTHIKYFPTIDVKVNEKIFHESKILGIDSSFFDIFSFDLLKISGDYNIINTYEIFISEDISKKYFGNQDALGEVIEFDSIQVTVKGIFKNLPKNSHIEFDILASIDLLKHMGYNHPWGYYTYILSNNKNIKDLTEKTAEVGIQQIPLIKRFQMKLDLQPLASLHFDNRFGSEVAITGDKHKVNQLIIVGFIIILVVCINYIIFSFAEINLEINNWAVRKILGARKIHFFYQNLLNTIFNIVIAFLIASIIIEFFWDYYARLINKSLIISYTDFSFLFGYIFIFLIILIIISIITLLFLSKLKPVNALRQKYYKTTKNISLNSILVVIQFFLAMCIIVALLVQIKQYRYMFSFSKNFDSENIFTISLNNTLTDKYQLFKEKLERSELIQAVSLSGCPLYRADKDYIRWEGKRTEDNVFAEVIGVDYDFFGLIGGNIITGRDFSEEFKTDFTDAFIITQKAAKDFGIEQPTGKKIQISNKNGIIIGVVKDMYFKSLKYNLFPQVFFIQDDFQSKRLRDVGSVMIKFKKGHEKEVQKYINQLLVELNLQDNVEAENFDDKINSQYSEERQSIKLYFLFTIIAILISCIGLYGTVSLLIVKRTKEIGIRKVLGASTRQIINSITWSFFKWIIISIILALPASYWIMRNLVENFAYKTHLSFNTIIVAIIVVVISALIPLFIRIHKIAGRDPIESLRYE